MLLANIYGCVALLAGAAGGAGTAKWLSDKLVEEVEATFDKTVQATKSAMDALKLEITKEVSKADVAQITGKYIDDRMIWIDVRPVSKSITKVDIRVGAKGNRQAAREILDAIKKYL
jgi:hypothetical protein